MTISPEIKFSEEKINLINIIILDFPYYFTV